MVRPAHSRDDVFWNVRACIRAQDLIQDLIDVAYMDVASPTMFSIAALMSVRTNLSAVQWMREGIRRG